ncbi:MAG: hypothetical protein IPI12_00560 [Ignavibacteriales bacterium]|nr:hypothetical protein [Ignavibacteriales bacterium]
MVNQGVGKTSIISQLRNHRTSEIQLRYYTFKPIAPGNDQLPVDAGITTTARSLWGDLLSQLRDLFKGKLSENRVPIRNDFIPTADKIRDEVIRLSKAWAQLNGKKTVICIDGIDHAARAEIDNGNYLSSLIQPDNVPEEIVFIISGQSGDSYEKYPLWLRQDNENVYKIEIPNLNENDISQLIKHSGVTLDLEPSTRLILNHTDGNTLSVLYAIETLKESKDLLFAKEEFENNRLREGLNTYYNTLWQNCSLHFHGSYSLPLKIACIFSLSAARLNLKNFNFIVPECRKEDWSVILHKLSPIIKKDNSGYRVLHNDVKVFFTKMISSGCEDIYPGIASNLIKLYFSEDIFIRQGHDELVKLLKKSNNTARILEFLSPKFILEAFIAKSSDSVLEEQIKIGLNEAIKKSSLLMISIISIVALKVYYNLITQFLRLIQAGYIMISIKVL